MLNQSDLARAVEYPYNIPSCSYCVELNNATYREIEGLEVVECEEVGAFEPNRYTITLSSAAGLVKLNKVSIVAAAGSNASPDQLLRKYGGTSIQTIYCLRVRFLDVAPVYSAHFTPYGAIAACLVPLAGATGHLFLSFLNENALQRMHETESLGTNFEFKRLGFGRHNENWGIGAPNLYFYKSLHGPLLSKHGAPILLSAFDFKVSHMERLSEKQVLQAISQELIPGTTIEDFVERVVINGEDRMRFTGMLKKLRI